MILVFYCIYTTRIFFFNFIVLRKFYPNADLQAEVNKTNTNEPNVTNTATSPISLFNLEDSTDSYLIDDALVTQKSVGSLSATSHSNDIAFGSCSANEFDQNSTPKQSLKIVNGALWKHTDR